MTTTRAYHEMAMDLAQSAVVAREKGGSRNERELASWAFHCERRALDMVPKAPASEPTWSILCLSAGSLAMQARMYREATEVLRDGLSGWPSPRTKADIEEVLAQVQALERDPS